MPATHIEGVEQGLLATVRVLGNTSLGFRLPLTGWHRIW